jgi:hypothetical protein
MHVPCFINAVCTYVEWLIYWSKYAIRIITTQLEQNLNTMQRDTPTAGQSG